MASRTSTQSGNFNSTATWGGNPVPVDGDNFTVANGHVVTINSDVRVTNGFNDSYVNGKLHVVNGGKFRMNGILYVQNNGNHAAYFAEGNASTAGFLRMDPGAICELKGAAADQHSIRMTAAGYTTLEIIGTNPNPQTSLTADADNNATELSVDDPSQFAIGDQITVFKPERTGKGWAYNNSDEAMWIHDIDYNNYKIYFRKFVSPKTNIISATSTTVVVDDASVLRVGYQIIFGTDTNRNIKTITNINYSTNSLTVNSSVTGSVVGTIVYRTGLDKGHLSGDNVLRLAAVLTADSAAGSNTITVNNTNGFSVGDTILICANNTDYDGSWDRIEDYVITNIDTNTKVITFTSGFSSPAQTTLQVAVKAGVGGLVVNLTRDTKVISPEGTTYGTNNACFIYWDYVSGSGGTAPYYRRIKIKNVEIGCGTNNQSSYFGSVGGRGHQSYELVSYGQYTFEFDGNAIYPTYRIYNLCGNFWEHHQCNFRNNVFYNTGNNGIGRYGSSVGMFGNIFTRVLSPIYHEGMYSDISETSYNYVVRCYYGIGFSQFYESHSIVRQNYCVFLGWHPYGQNYQNGNTYISDCYFDYFVIWPNMDRVSVVLFNNCYFGNSWDVTNFRTGGVYSDSINVSDIGSARFERRSANNSTIISLNHNFKYNGALQSNNRALKFYDNNEQAWRVYPDRDQSGYMGFSNDIMVPANSQVFIKGVVKTASGNTNYPYLIARHFIDIYSGRYKNNTDTALDPTVSISNITPHTGFWSSSQFTSSSSDYQTINMTIPALPFDYCLVVGIACNGSSNNSRLGWWEKDVEIAIENPYGYNEARHLINTLTTRLPVQVKQTSNQLKTILGG